MDLTRLKKLSGMGHTLNDHGIEGLSLSELNKLKVQIENRMEYSTMVSESYLVDKRRLSQVLKRIETLTEQEDDEPVLSESAARGEVLIKNAKSGPPHDPIYVNKVMIDSPDVEEIFGKNLSDETVEKEDVTGYTQDAEVPVEVPAKILKQIDDRIAELEVSMDEFDKTTYQVQWNYKQNAIDALYFIKEKLERGDLASFKQAVVHFHQYANFISELLPATLINFLHTGMEQKYALKNNNQMKDKLSPGNPYSNALPTDTVEYPQKARSKPLKDFLTKSI